MARTFSNNAESTLASGILAGATSLTVATGDGAEFPATGDFTVRIEDASVSTSFELVTCTARSGDVLTISATAGAWDAGDKVFHVVAKADLDAFLQTGTQASAIVVNPTVNGADDVQEALTALDAATTTVRVPHTWAVKGTAVNGELPGFFVSLPAGQTGAIVAARYATESGTVTAQVRKNGVALTDLTALAVSSTAATTDEDPDVALADGDYIDLNLSSASSPVDLRFSVFVEMTV